MLSAQKTAGRAYPRSAVLGWLEVVAASLLRLEWVVVLLAAPLLLTTSRFSTLGVGLLVIPLVAGRVATGTWLSPSRYGAPLLLLSGMALLSVLVSARLDYSLPRLFGLALGLGVFCACLRTCTMPAARRWARWALLLAGMALSVLAFVGTAFPASKVIDVSGVAKLLPRLITSVQSSTGPVDGIPSNELGGVLVLLLPYAIVALGRGSTRFVGAIAAVGMSTALLLAGSRAALVGVIVALGFGFVLRFGWRGVVGLLLAGIVAGSLAATWDGGVILGTVLQSGTTTPGLDSLAGRTQIWARGLTMLLDMPLTGIGLNTFPQILPLYYPVTFYQPLIAHAHDLYLQVALDFGIPGLAAFMLVVIYSVRAGWRAMRAGVDGDLAAGLLLGLLAYGIYSCVDAVALGAKPSFLLWAVLGLLAAMDREPAIRTTAWGPGHWLGVQLTRFRAAVPGRAGALLCVAGLLIVVVGAASPITVNASRLAAYKQIGTPAVTGTLISALSVTSYVAWGPYLGRAWAARSLLEEQQHETPAALQSLSNAVIADPWDSGSALRLGDMRLAAGDEEGAIDAWRLAGAEELLLLRAQDQSNVPSDELLWLDRAEAVDPTDPRAYVRSIDVRVSEGDAVGAQQQLVRGMALDPSSDEAHLLSQRLVDGVTPVPGQLPSVLAPERADLYSYASLVFLDRSDVSAALYSAEVATAAYGGRPIAWVRLADEADKQELPAVADQARARAAELSR